MRRQLRRPEAGSPAGRCNRPAQGCGGALRTLTARPDRSTIPWLPTLQPPTCGGHRGARGRAWRTGRAVGAWLGWQSERRRPMPYMLIRHKVADYAKWKPMFDAHGPTRRAHTFKGGQLLRNADDPNELVILW